MNQEWNINANYVVDFLNVSRLIKQILSKSVEIPRFYSVREISTLLRVIEVA